MPSDTYDITIEQGVTYILNIEYIYDGQNYDFTDHEIRMQVRASYDATATLVDIDNADKGGITVTGTGVFQIVIAASATAALSMTVAGRYDIEIEDDSGVVTRLLEGKAKFSREITR